MQVKIKYSRYASRTEAFELISEGWHEAVQDGLTPDFVGVCPVGPTSEVVYAVSPDDDIVGVLAWNHDDPQGVFDVVLYYVEPTSRKQGVFKALFAAVYEHARKRGVRAVRIAIPSASGAHKSAVESLGFQAVSVIYEAECAAT